MRLKDKMFVVIGSEDSYVRVRLNPEHPIYQAHFPGNPITPGVCIVQMIGELLEEPQGEGTLQLKKIANLKFVAPISPLIDPVIDIDFSQISREDDEVKTRGAITAQGRLMTKFSIVFKS